MRSADRTGRTDLSSRAKLLRAVDAAHRRYEYGLVSDSPLALADLVVRVSVSNAPEKGGNEAQASSAARQGIDGQQSQSTSSDAGSGGRRAAGACARVVAWYTPTADPDQMPEVLPAMFEQMCFGAAAECDLAAD